MKGLILVVSAILAMVKAQEPPRIVVKYAEYSTPEEEDRISAQWSAPAPVSPPVNGKVYQGFKTALDYGPARKECQAKGGELATWSSSSEFHQITTIVKSLGQTVWVGLNDAASDGVWEFLDGTPCTAGNCNNLPQWAQGEPNEHSSVSAGLKGEDCAELYYHSFELNDQSCNDKRYFVCQFIQRGPRPPPPSGQAAVVKVNCDNEFVAKVSYNGGATSQLVKTGNSWPTTYSFTVPAVTAATQIEIICTDVGVVGGFIATVQYDGDAYYTTNPLSAGNWEVTSATKGGYAPHNLYYTAYPAWNNAVSVAPGQSWVWNRDVWNTMTFKFNFANILSGGCSSALSCPSGSIQVGNMDAGIPGCGLQACHERYTKNNIEECEDACNLNGNCQAFNWAPLGGDLHTPQHKVCTLYDMDYPTIAGTLDQSQIFCKPVLECPSGSKQVGAMDAAIPGCGLTMCHERFTYDSIEECKNGCEENDQCNGFTFAPIGGDLHTPQNRVCTFYDAEAPTIPGTMGQTQIFCKLELTCPAGSVRVGDIDYGIKGCGLTGCGERFGYNTIDDCRAACEARTDCKAFNWAPYDGDLHHPQYKVCTFYDVDAPDTPGVPGQDQIFCKLEGRGAPPTTPTSKRYEGFKTALDYGPARKQCQAKGGELACWSSSAEYNQINTIATTLGGSGSWVGLQDNAVESRWEFVDNTPCTGGSTPNNCDKLPQWSSGEPNAASGASIGMYGEDCAEIRPFNGLLNDQSCNDKRYYICQFLDNGNPGSNGCCTAAIAWSSAMEKCEDVMTNSALNGNSEYNCKAGNGPGIWKLTGENWCQWTACQNVGYCVDRSLQPQMEPDQQTVIIPIEHDDVLYLTSVVDDSAATLDYQRTLVEAAGYDFDDYSLLYEFQAASDGRDSEFKANCGRPVRRRPRPPKPTKAPKTKKPKPTKGPKPTKAPKTKKPKPTKAPKWPTPKPTIPVNGPPVKLKGCERYMDQSGCNAGYEGCEWISGYPPAQIVQDLDYMNLKRQVEMEEGDMDVESDMSYAQDLSYTDLGMEVEIEEGDIESDMTYVDTFYAVVTDPIESFTTASSWVQIMAIICLVAIVYGIYTHYQNRKYKGYQRLPNKTDTKYGSIM